MRRAVITGLGIVSSIGVNKEEVLASLKAGKSGITFSEQFAEMGLRSQVWGDINIELDQHVFEINRERATDYLNTQERLFVVDAFAGWDPKYRIKVRIVCTRAYHALFMQNMLIMPSAEELENFGEPDYVIFNAGGFPANRHTSKMTSKTVPFNQVSRLKSCAVNSLAIVRNSLHFRPNAVPTVHRWLLNNYEVAP